MTAAAFARDDLEMSMPGNAYLQHSGQAEAWPVDEEGRYLPAYANNTFGGHKSYHVVGELNDFFGGYYHDDDYGFGHWARYEDMPGQKLWLWALSREGGVWEDLLTDTDGQYVEFQAGRLFVQYSPGSAREPHHPGRLRSHVRQPVDRDLVPPGGDRRAHRRLPGGSPARLGRGGRLHLGVNAFRTIQDTLKVWSGGELVATAPVSLDPSSSSMPASTFWKVSPSESGCRDWAWTTRRTPPSVSSLAPSPPRGTPGCRPRRRLGDGWVAASVDRKVFQARELMKGRWYAQARGRFEEAVREEPWNREARLRLAELSSRRGLFEEGLEHLDRPQLDAYDARGELLAGTPLSGPLGRTAACPGRVRMGGPFLWPFESAAYTQLAEIMIGRRKLDRGCPLRPACHRLRPA